MISVLFSKNVMAQEQPTCPSIEVIRNVQFVKASQNPYWVVESAIFRANNANWQITLETYYNAHDSYEAIAYVQGKWKKVALYGPNPDGMGYCTYIAGHPSDLNWITAWLVK